MPIRASNLTAQQLANTKYTKYDPLGSPYYSQLLSSVNMTRFGSAFRVLVITIGLYNFVTDFFASSGWIKFVSILLVHLALQSTSVLAIMILRKSYLRTTYLEYPNLFSELSARAIKPFLPALFTYSTAAAGFFFLFSIAKTSVTMAPSNVYDAPRLNEEWVYNVTLPITAGICYACAHVVLDFDRLAYDVSSDESPARSRILSRWQRPLIRGLIAAVAINVLHLILYPIFIRSPAWSFWQFVVRIFMRLHKSRDYYYVFPLFFTSFVRSLLYSIFVFSLWELTHLVFSVYLTLGASHRGGLLSERADEPNKTLMTGLKAGAKHAYVQTTAFHELLFIAINDDPTRRLTIYLDSAGNLWSDIQRVCVSLLMRTATSKSKHTENSAATSTGVANADAAKLEQRGGSRPEMKQLRNGRSVSVKVDPSVFNKRSKPPIVSSFQDPTAMASRISISFIEKVSSFLRGTISKTVMKSIDETLLTKAGFLFANTPERQAHCLIPNPQLISCVLWSLLGFIEHSFTEDQLGVVQSTISNTLDEIDQLMVRLEHFVGKFPEAIVQTSDNEIKIKQDLSDIYDILEICDEVIYRIAETFQNCLQNLHLTKGVEIRILKMERGL